MTDNSTKAADLPQDLLDLLVCPLDKAKVHPEGMTLCARSAGAPIRCATASRS